MDRSSVARYLEIPVNYGQASLSFVHDSLGLPWWATIVATGIGMRAALLPVSARASAAAGNFVKSKRLVYQSTYKLLGDSSFNTCQPVLDSHGARAARLIAQVAQRPYSRLWLAAPLLQIPLFVTGAVSVSTLQDPGLVHEGMLWFPDLTKSGFDFHAAINELSRGLRTADLTQEQLDAMKDSIAPMGKYGILLPTAYFLLWRQNIRTTVENLSLMYSSMFGRKSSFSRTILKTAPAAKLSASRAANLVDVVAVAIFPVLISIPHTTLLYLFSSSAFLKITYHLGRLFDSPSPTQSPANQPAKKNFRSAAEETGDKHARPAAVSVKTLSDQAKVPKDADVNVLLDRAIVAYGQQNRAAAHMALKQAAKVCPEHPRLAFALAQVQRELRQWEEALGHYHQSLQLESNENHAHRARIHCAISTCFLSSKNARSALLAAIKAVETDATEPMCWMAKMHAERANGNITAAIQDAKHIADLDPELGKDLPRVLQQLQASSSVPSRPTKAI